MLGRQRKLISFRINTSIHICIVTLNIDTQNRTIYTHTHNHTIYYYLYMKIVRILYSINFYIYQRRNKSYRTLNIILQKQNFFITYIHSPLYVNMDANISIHIFIQYKYTFITILMDHYHPFKQILVEWPLQLAGKRDLFILQSFLNISKFKL